MKTNKSFTKRLRLTKTGKILARQPGQDHFNARARRSKQMAKRRTAPFAMKNKQISRYLPDLVK